MKDSFLSFLNRPIETDKRKDSVGDENKWRRSGRRGRRQGAVLIYVVLSATVLLGICAIVIDEGYWFIRKADLQKAADASAMVGAARLAENLDSSVAIQSSKDYAKDNGYEDGQRDISVNPTIDTSARLFTVSIVKRETGFFGGILGISNTDINAVAVASYNTATSILIPITGRTYGVNNGPINVGIYGPDQISARGDKFSTKYKTIDGVTGLNPDYRPEGYNFFVALPTDPNFGETASLQIYDPDSYDSGADTTAANKRWDEQNGNTYGDTGSGFGRVPGNPDTITRYTIYSDNGTPYNNSDDTQIGNPQEYGNDAASDKQWVNSFDLQVRTIKNLRPDKDVNVRLQVQTISGSSENGFNLRVARPSDTDATFASGGNGTNISAVGSLPVNFGASGTGNVALGDVPRGATEVVVKHFDSDVGVVAGTTINYNDGSTDYTGNPLLGRDADDIEENDTFALGSGYAGGSWRASYSAGASDNTTWDLSYSGPPDGNVSEIRLVR